MTSADYVRAGLERLRKYGWQQNSFGTREAGFCAIGAIPYRDVRTEAGLAVYEVALAATGHADPERLATWNDAYVRTQAEVEAVYERVIAQAA